MKDILCIDQVDQRNIATNQGDHNVVNFQKYATSIKLYMTNSIV